MVAVDSRYVHRYDAIMNYPALVAKRAGSLLKGILPCWFATKPHCLDSAKSTVARIRPKRPDLTRRHL